jgi:hypothetical protein
MMQFVKIINGYPTIDIGAMRHQFTWLVQNSVPGSAGQEVQYLPASPPYTMMAAVDTVRGSDVIRGGQTASQTYLEAAAWYDPNFKANDRILNDNGSVYVVQSIENILEMGVVMVLNLLAIGPNT